jgi:PTS system nitrogen regulatory IIA component
MSNDILTAQEVARYLRIPRTTVYDLAQQRKLPAFKVGRHWRFKRVKLEAWVEQQDPGSQSQEETRRPGG